MVKCAECKPVAIYEELTKCILNGKALDGITSSLSELMKCIVVFEDCHLVLKYTGIPEQPIGRELLDPYLSILQSPSFKKTATLYLQQKRPCQIVDQYSEGLLYRLFSPIAIGGRVYAYISLLRSKIPFSESDFISLEHATRIFALKLLEEKKIDEVESRLKGDFLTDLLSGKLLDCKSIINRANAIQYDITSPHRVVVLEIDNLAQAIHTFKSDEHQFLQFKTQLAKIVQCCLERYGKGMLDNIGESLVMLVQLNSPNCPEKAVRQLAENTIKKMKQQFPEVKISAGIGTICTELTDFHRSFLAAKKAIEIGKAFKKQGQVISLEQFGVHALLFNAIKPTDLCGFATNEIGTLLAYDETTRAQLIPTLQEFLSHSGNIEATARTMNISVSGLRYRLQRIEDITEKDLKDSYARYGLQLALNIFQLVDVEKMTNTAE